MKRFSFFSLFMFGLLLGNISCKKQDQTGRTVQDLTGQTVTIPTQVSRVVTLAPSLGELAADLLQEDLSRIVGVSEYTDYPNTLKKVESIGSYVKFNLEKVVALKPDVVFATRDGNAKDQIQHLREMNIPVIVFNTQDLSQILDSIRLMGTVLEKTPRSEELVSYLQKSVAEFQSRARERFKSTPPTRVMLQLGEDPLIVVGGGVFLNEMLGWVGAKNIYSDLADGYPKPSMEDVLQRDPEAIMVLALSDHLEPFQKIAENWKRFQKLSAVKRGRISVIHEDGLVRPTRRLVEGLRALEKALVTQP